MSRAGEDDMDDELDGFDYQNISPDFKEMMRTTLTWHHLQALDIWVFWTDSDDADNDDDDESETTPLHITHSATPETPPMADWRINMKLRSLIRKLLMELEPVGHSLVQFWVPKPEAGGRIVLTTADQPFGINFIDKTVCSLRMESMELEPWAYGDDDAGILGHVFQKRVTAITPNVKFFSCEDYSQVTDAINAGIQSSIVCPVIDPSGDCCIGVLEVLSSSDCFPTSTVIRVIEEVGFRSSGIHGHDISPVDYCSHSRAVKEMENGMKVVCETHKLPLAQAWFRCKCASCRDVKSGGSCLIPENKYSEGISYALDDSAKDFLRACSSDALLRTLLKGQGVAGRALASNTPCLCRDVTRFNIAEYPLVHLARVYGLAGSFAICLRSTHIGDADYVLEFFLPRKRNGWDPRPLLCSVLETMEEQFPSFEAASGEALGGNLSVEFLDLSVSKKGCVFQICSNSPRSAFQPLKDMMQLEKVNSNTIFSENIGIGYGPSFYSCGALRKSPAAGDSWRKVRAADDLHGEEKSKRLKRAQGTTHGC